MGLSAVPESWAVNRGQYNIYHHMCGLWVDGQRLVVVLATYPPVSCEVRHKRVGMMVDSLLGRGVASQ